MKPTNYFKVSGTVERTFGFEAWSRSSTKAAWNLATLFQGRHGGRLSVFYPVPLAGPWSSTPVIAGESATLPVWQAPAEVPAFGEAGCY